MSTLCFFPLQQLSLEEEEEEEEEEESGKSPSPYEARAENTRIKMARIVCLVRDTVL